MRTASHPKTRDVPGHSRPNRSRRRPARLHASWLGLLGLAVGCGSAPPPAIPDAFDAAPEQDAGQPPVVLEGASGLVEGAVIATPPAPTCVFCEEAGPRGLLVDGPAYGRGAAWVDIDGDGWEDLWQSDTGTGQIGHARTSALYRNLGNGTFEPFDLGVPAEALYRNWAASFDDYDDDGDPDLFLVNGGYSTEVGSALYRNDLADTGTFTDVTDVAGISRVPARWWSGAFADFDSDGHLDLAVSSINGPLALYHNEGDGTFRDDTHSLGLRGPIGDTKNVVWFDYDRDGDQDLYVAGMNEHILFRSDDEGFTDVTHDVLNPTGVGPPVFAAAAADFDQDGWEDLYLGRWDRQDYVLLNDQNGHFEAFGPDIGLDMAVFPILNENTMGLGVGDLGDDGWPEVLIGPGRPSGTGLPIVYCHEGQPLGFHRCSEDFIRGQGESRNHGVVLADFDHDGDTDVFWNVGGHVEFDLSSFDDTTEPGALYVQQSPATPRVAVVHLVGTVSNRDAIGARLVVDGTETRYYWIHGQQGFPGQNATWLPVSLGDAPDGTVTVEWPSGIVSVTDLHRGDRIEIVEPAR